MRPGRQGSPVGVRLGVLPYSVLFTARAHAADEGIPSRRTPEHATLPERVRHVPNSHVRSPQHAEELLRRQVLPDIAGEPGLRGELLLAGKI